MQLHELRRFGLQSELPSCYIGPACASRKARALSRTACLSHAVLLGNCGPGSASRYIFIDLRAAEGYEPYFRGMGHRESVGGVAAKARVYSDLCPGSQNRRQPVRPDGKSTTDYNQPASRPSTDASRFASRDTASRHPNDMFFGVRHSLVIRARHRPVRRPYQHRCPSESPDAAASQSPAVSAVGDRPWRSRRKHHPSGLVDNSRRPRPKPAVTPRPARRTVQPGLAHGHPQGGR